MPVKLISWGEKNHWTLRLCPRYYLTIPNSYVRLVLNASSKSSIHQYYQKSQAQKGIAELGYEVPDSVTSSAYHIA